MSDATSTVTQAETKPVETKPTDTSHYFLTFVKGVMIFAGFCLIGWYSAQIAKQKEDKQPVSGLNVALTTIGCILVIVGTLWSQYKEVGVVGVVAIAWLAGVIVGIILYFVSASKYVHVSVATDNPTTIPSTATPSAAPSAAPSGAPKSAYVTIAPTVVDATVAPTGLPTTLPPTLAPTGYPTTIPTTLPPTLAPTGYPTTMPTTLPPTLTPTGYPTITPTTLPPTLTPTGYPSMTPTTLPPTLAPTAYPTTLPPTLAPTSYPTTLPPTLTPTGYPTITPTTLPPTLTPTGYPTTLPPTLAPTGYPTTIPTTLTPTGYPTTIPTTLTPTKMSFAVSKLDQPSKDLSGFWYLNSRDNGVLTYEGLVDVSKETLKQGAWWTDQWVGRSLPGNEIVIRFFAKVPNAPNDYYAFGSATQTDPGQWMQWKDASNAYMNGEPYLGDTNFSMKRVYGSGPTWFTYDGVAL